MTDLELRIITILQKNMTGISGAEIAKECGVSVNTARKYIGNLRYIMLENGLEIVSRTSVGFSLKVKNKEKARIFFRAINDRTGNPLFGKQTSQEYKTNYIIRRLLVSKCRVPLEILCDELFYSVSSVRRDLKKIESYLADYDLILTLKRGEGYTIEGNEWGKRLCLLAQHKVFVNLDESYKRLEENFSRVFGLGNENVRKKRHAVRNAIYKSSRLAFKMTNLQILTNYIPLIKNRENYAFGIRISDEQSEYIERSGITEEAERILSAAGREYIRNETEIRTYAMLLLAFRTIPDKSYLTEDEVNFLSSDLRDIKRLLGKRFAETEHINDEDILCCWAGVRSRQAFHLTPDDEDSREFEMPNPIVKKICVELSGFFEDKYDQKFSIRQFTDIYYCILRILYEIYKKTIKCRVLVLSRYGIRHAEFCVDLIKSEYGSFISEIRAAEYTEVCGKKNEEYDILVHNLKSDLLDGLINKDKTELVYIDDSLTKNWDLKEFSKLLESRKELEKIKFTG
ncbi:HTH domain-containing protein [Lachnospiraceae bacterium C1.1]|nr:HTH domain-containing protein [Lachnospiraceae bacterium C1.1]